MNHILCMSNSIQIRKAAGFVLPARTKGKRGLTIIELTIVIGIILVLAAIAVPSIFRGRKQAQIGALAEEFRLNYESFVLYAQEKGTLPQTATAFSTVPVGMRDYLPKRSTWETDNHLGSLTTPQFRGQWYWVGTPVAEYPGYNGFIMFYSPDLDDDVAKEIDTKIDDGDITTGGMRFEQGQGEGSGKWLYFAIQ